MITLDEIQIGQELNVRLKVVDCHPGGVSFEMPSGVHVYLNKKDFDRLAVVPGVVKEDETT